MEPRDPQRPQTPEETPPLAAEPEAVAENFIENPTAPPAVGPVESAPAYSKEPQHVPATPESHVPDQGPGQSADTVPGPSVDSAPSVASTAGLQQEAPPEDDRPDDTDFIQQPVQDAQVAEEQDLEAEDSDNDSAFGSETQSITTTLSESIFNYRKEHGRTYHAYKDGKYIFPNDDREADRLDLQHHIFQLTYGNRLHFAPLDDPKRAIDIGTGTGIWAIDFADSYPKCEVTGIDLSPGQPTLVPPNLRFLIDDAEDLWIYPEPFDYIHARLMAGCFADWPNFFRQAYQHLEPGGWLEIQDYGLPIKSFDNTHLNTDIFLWGQLLCSAARQLGRPMGSDVSEHYEEWMRETGFVDIRTENFMWPTNPWPKDPYYKELGRWNMMNILDGLEGFCLALLTRAFGWTKAEVDVFVAKCSADLRNPRIHAYFPMPVVYGRKPFDHEN